MIDKYQDNIPNVTLTGKAYGLFSGDFSIPIDDEKRINSEENI